MKESVFIIAGPTASGKSALALDVAVKFDGTIINADSMQVYQDLNVLSARPSKDDLERAPHRLYGFRAAEEPCSAGQWLDLAVAEIKAAWAESRLPLVVGGTGMYLKALMEGLAPIPDVPESIREQTTALHRDLGGEAFKRELSKLDSGTADRLPAGDTQRLIRAYEVALATGRPLSDWQKDHPSDPPLQADFGVIVLSPERAVLYDSVNRRFDWMMENGALEEVRALMDRDLDPSLPAMKAVGVPELKAFLAGEKDRDRAMEDAKRATRQFAKRQLTWLRNQLQADFTLSAQYSESFMPEIFSFISKFMLTQRS